MVSEGLLTTPRRNVKQFSVMNIDMSKNGIGYARVGCDNHHKCKKELPRSNVVVHKKEECVPTSLQTSKKINRNKRIMGKTFYPQMGQQIQPACIAQPNTFGLVQQDQRLEQNVCAILAFKLSTMTGKGL